jgi:hypothetical protein
MQVKLSRYVSELPEHRAYQILLRLAIGWDIQSNTRAVNCGETGVRGILVVH